ncbi:cold-shock protein [Marinomonas sp. IMCC 4694]|uniref:cold-shock protein n=1 Tax=Marinomonas sp. IMCC 4694 TaxID=2605432 RepID=UPI0011E79781|nr:cold shock domain-containing protein [Marinomonas sp. IMCC 4694]TYL46744.1 cold shock domain-containing protein [Marinomonas sp. IMCC 4694]
MERLSGKVKWFNDAKGVGFIQREEDCDVFVHYKSIVSDGHKTLRKGQVVSFELTDTDFGVQAIGIQLEKETKPVIPYSNKQRVNA